MNKIEVKQRLFKDIKRRSITLSPDEQMNLFFKYKNEKCLNSRDKLINANLRLISQTAYFFIQNWNVDEEAIKDIHQSAYFYAIQSLDSFDPSKGKSTVPTWIRTCVWNKLNYLFKTWFDGNGEMNMFRLSSSYKDRLISNDIIEDQLLKKGEIPVDGKIYEIKGKKVKYKFIPTPSKTNVQDESSMNIVYDETIKPQADINDKLVSTLKTILSEREFLIFYNYNSGLATENDLRYQIKHESTVEYNKALERGKNIYHHNGVKKVLYFYPHVEIEDLTEDKYVKYENYVIFSEKADQIIFYNNKLINAVYDEKNHIYKYIISLQKKGYPLTSASIGNINVLAMDKVRAYMIKNKIKTQDELF